jgi:outer membrane protein assembly factor BamB
VRIPPIPIACCVLLLAGTPAEAQPRPRPPSGPGAAARAAATPATALEATLAVALDAQPSAPAAFDAADAFVPLKGGRLVAINLSSGRVRWDAEITTTFAPAVSAGVVIVAADELLIALDAPTGRPKWRVPVAGGFSAPPAIRDGWVVASAAGGDVLTLRAADGAVIWTRNAGAPVRVQPIIAPSGVYASLDDGRVVCFDLTSGAPRWERRLDGKPGPLLVLGDRLFVGGDDKFFYSLNTGNGGVRWRQRVGGRPAGPAAADAKHVYYVALDNILWAFDRGNGGRKWHAPLPIRPSGGPLVVGDAVIVAGVSAVFHAYRAATGEVAGTSESDADLAAPPQVIPGAVPGLTTIATVTRTGVFTLLSRRVEPAATPLPYPLGAEVPLSAVVPD